MEAFEESGMLEEEDSVNFFLLVSQLSKTREQNVVA